MEQRFILPCLTERIEEVIPVEYMPTEEGIYGLEHQTRLVYYHLISSGCFTELKQKYPLYFSEQFNVESLKPGRWEPVAKNSEPKSVLQEFSFSTPSSYS